MQAHPSTVQDVFYALLLDEIAAQPNLQDELGANELGDVAIKAFGVVLEVALAFYTSGVGTAIKGVGFRVVKQLLPPPKSVLRDVGEIMAMVSGSNYNALCRSALLHLFWGELEKAERKVNLAKHKHDDRAFAHHVYGILRGLQGDARRAQFELHLAREREQLGGPRRRIERALQAIDRLK